MDVMEMHEAFSEQVPANFKAWEHGWKEPDIGCVERSGDVYEFPFIWRETTIKLC